jgi:hypothetical protein
VVLVGGVVPLPAVPVVPVAELLPVSVPPAAEAPVVALPEVEPDVPDPVVEAPVPELGPYIIWSGSRVSEIGIALV